MADEFTEDFNHPSSKHPKENPLFSEWAKDWTKTKLVYHQVAHELGAESTEELREVAKSESKKYFPKDLEDKKLLEKSFLSYMSIGDQLTKTEEAKLFSKVLLSDKPELQPYLEKILLGLNPNFKNIKQEFTLKALLEDRCPAIVSHPDLKNSLATHAIYYPEGSPPPAPKRSIEL